MASEAAKKKIGRPKKEKPDHIADRSLVDMRSFFESLDWVELWERWNLDLNDNGFLKYRSIREFSQEIGLNELQKKFLAWYLGPVGEDTKTAKDNAAKWAFVGAPQDWLTLRKTQGWNNDQNRERYAKLVAQKQGALEKMEEVGSQVILRRIYKVMHMAEAVEENFSAGILLPNFSASRNDERARLFCYLQRQFADLITTYHESWMASLGVNVHQMDALTQMLAAANVAKISGSSKDSGVGDVIRALTEAALIKAHQFSIPLPDDMKAKLIEGAVQPDPVAQKKKAN